MSAIPSDEQTIIDDASDPYFHEKFLALALVYGPLAEAGVAYAELENFVAAFEKIFNVDLDLNPSGQSTRKRLKSIETALDWMDRYARWYKEQETPNGQAGEAAVHGA